MIRKIYSVKDRVSGVFSDPFFCNSNSEAIYRFKCSCASVLDKRPSDFDLYYLGDFENVNSNLFLLNDKGGEFLVSGSDEWLEEKLLELISNYSQILRTNSEFEDRIRVKMKELQVKYDMYSVEDENEEENDG